MDFEVYTKLFRVTLLSKKQPLKKSLKYQLHFSRVLLNQTSILKTDVLIGIWYKIYLFYTLLYPHYLYKIVRFLAMHNINNHKVICQRAVVDE